MNRFTIYILAALVWLPAVSAWAQVTIVGSSSQITTDPASQIDPSISGDIVVFTDSRNLNDDIYYVDLSDLSEHQVTFDSADQELHDVSGTRIVYNDFSFPSGAVVVYDISDDSTEVLTSGGQFNPGIGGDIVAYEDTTAGQSDIYIANLTTGLTTQVTNTAEDEFNPGVGGTYIVFERAYGNLRVTVLYDMVTGDEIELGTGRQPHTDGATVVFHAPTSDFGQDIFVHDIVSGDTDPLALPGKQTRGHVHGDLLAYDDDSTGDPDVVIHHLPSGATARIGGTTVEFLNDLDGNHVAYTSMQSGNLDIWVYEFEIVDPQVLVEPMPEVNYGDVEIGTSEEMIVSITSIGYGDLEVTNVVLFHFGFAIEGISVDDSPVAAPFTLASGETAEITISFTPGSEMSFNDTVRIETDDADQAIVDVDLKGVGVLSEQPPSEQIASILAFFDGSVVSGDLGGAGNGNSANGRLGAMRNMIEAAGDLIESGMIGDACTQLQDAMRRTDGLTPPPDFVTGSAAAELAMLIEDLIELLDCP